MRPSLPTALCIGAAVFCACSGARDTGAAPPALASATPAQGDSASNDPVPAANGPLLEGGRYSYCDPAAAIAAYPRFTARPEVVSHLYPSGGGRDYPVIDVHTHLLTTRDDEAEIHRRVGLYAVVDAARDAVSTSRRRADYPVPNVVQFSLVDYLQRFDPSRVPDILAQLAAQRDAGAGGIKVFKALGLALDDAAGKRLRIDDPGLHPIWRRAAEERWPVSIHVGDPNSWMPSPDETPYTKQDLVQQFVRVVSDHPTTVFVAIHLLNLVDAEEELDQLGELLDAHPNLYADVAARSQYLVLRDQRHVRNFFIAHQDQLLFATDRYEQADPVPGYEEELRYWETSGPTRTYYLNVSARGLELPPDALEKLYYKNALRVFCAQMVAHSP